MVEARGGVCIAAHIDRSSNSILSNLGFIPEDLNFKTLEVSKRAPAEMSADPKYKYIHDSDAHYLTDISEAVWKLTLEEKSVEAVLNALRG